MAPSHEPWHRPRTKTSPYNLTSRNFHYFVHQIHMVIQFTKKRKYLKNKLRTKHNHHFYKIQTCKTYIIASLDFISTMGKWEFVDSTESGLYELPAQLTNSTGVHTEVKADKNGHGTDLVFSLQFFIFEGICLEVIMIWFRAVGSALDLTWFDVNIRFDLDVNTSDSWIHDPKGKMKNMKKYTLDQGSSLLYIYNCYAVLWLYSEFTDLLLENV